MMTEEYKPTKFSVMPLLREERSPRHAPFVNLDAKYLSDMADEMDGEAEPDEASMRLRGIAARLERLDEQVRNLQATDAFKAGIVEGKRRYLARSNLPVQSVELNPDLAKAIAAHPVTKVTAAKPQVSKKPSVLSLNGLVLDLSLLGKKEE